tara:strand:+ start:1562 stop:2710 length:1149 start_codon:yes stop_codon:yes gene_type:complete
MDAHEIFVEYIETQRLPNISKIKATMLTADTRGLEFIATMYLRRKKTINADAIFKDKDYVQLLLEAVPKTWTPTVVKVIQISRPTFPQLELYFDTMKQFAQPNTLRYLGETKNGDPSREELVTPRVRPREESATPRTMPRITTTISAPITSKTADEYMAEEQKRSIGVLVSMLSATVPADWVRECASNLIMNVPFSEKIEQKSFVLLQDGNKRHVHHIDNSVAKFLHTLSQILVEEIPNTITWQFSDSKKAIHMNKLADTLRKKCPKTPLAFIIFACALGIPTTKLMKTRDFLTRWKQFNHLSQDVVIKMLLRPIFETETMENEAVILLNKYVTHIQEFVPIEVNSNTIEKYFYERYYSYPTPDEMKFIWDRIEKNTKIYSI